MKEKSSITPERRLTKRELQEKVSEALHDSPDIRIGKAGITSGVLEAIKDYIERNDVCKVKVLQTVEDYKGNLTEIATRTNLKMVKRVGRTAIYCKKPQNRS